MLKTEIAEQPGSPLPWVLRVALDGNPVSTHHYASREAALAAAGQVSEAEIRRERAQATQVAGDGVTGLVQ